MTGLKELLNKKAHLYGCVDGAWDECAEGYIKQLEEFLTPKIPQEHTGIENVGYLSCVHDTLRFLRGTNK